MNVPEQNCDHFIKYLSCPVSEMNDSFSCFYSLCRENYFCNISSWIFYCSISFQVSTYHNEMTIWKSHFQIPSNLPPAIVGRRLGTLPKRALWLNSVWNGFKMRLSGRPDSLSSSTIWVVKMRPSFRGCFFVSKITAHSLSWRT